MDKQRKAELENALRAIREQTEGAKKIAGAQSIWKALFLLDFFAEQLIASLDDDSIEPPVIIKYFLNKVDKFSNVSISNDGKTIELQRINGQPFPRLRVNKKGSPVNYQGKIESSGDKNMDIAIFGIFKFFKPSFFKKPKKRSDLT